ncbi:MAG: hypothetical protein QOI59_4667 [Gammaproteobacteria bacterium]|jgi:hypothetical protein|nr:hypothetical protein [Gammaproteobacteria bacterium]
MVLKKFLIIGLLVLGIAAAAVLLFYAGDHDDEYRNSVPPAGRPLPAQKQPTSSRLITPSPAVPTRPRKS